MRIIPIGLIITALLFIAPLTIAFADGVAFDETETVTLPAFLVEMEKEAFESTAIKKAVFPHGMIRVGKNAFNEANSLSSVYLPETVQYIAESALPRNTDLTIYGINGSYAEEWAQAQKLRFIECDIWNNAESEDFLSDSVILDLFDMDLWIERDIQDASHVLMMPMHYAFKSNHSAAIAGFESFFDRFVETYEQSSFSALTRLQRMQFLYLASEFLKLGGKSEGLTEIIAKNAHEDLLAPATWNVEATVKEHLEQVLAHKSYKKSYYSMLVDADFYTLACLCNLKAIEIRNEDTEFSADCILALLSDPDLNTETEEGYWLFQVGVAKDYRDYAYAGNEYAYEGMEPKIREDIVSDTSHFRRMPLWLRSFRDAQDSAEGYSLMQKRIEQLGNLFAEKVLRLEAGYWVTTTFIDGTNGVFRYNYHGDGSLIEGYDQSGGALFLGYWIMLNNERIRDVYAAILERLPLPADSTNPYYDDGITVREQNPIMDKDNLWGNGLMTTIVKCNLMM